MPEQTLRQVRVRQPDGAWGDRQSFRSLQVGQVFCFADDDDPRGQWTVVREPQPDADGVYGIQAQRA